MSQNDFNIANQGFPSFRSDLNSSLQALASNSSGATEPDTTYAYQWWYDSTADVLKMRNADNDAWIIFAAFDQTTDSWYFSGNVGIGTSSPNTNLQVKSGSGGGLTLQADTATQDEYSQLGFVPSTNDAANPNAYIRGLRGTNSVGTFLTFGTSDTERMRIAQDGSLLVGTTVANGAVSISNGGTASYSLYSNAHPSNGYNVALRGGTTTGVAVRFLNSSGGDCGSIDYTATSTSYTTSSDYRLKTDAQPMTGASARVQALNPVNFEWIADGTRVDGFLAHEAQEVVPESVTGTKDAMRDEEYEVTPAVLDDEGNVVTEAVMGTRQVPDYQGIDQSKLVPLLTAALQEALTEIDDLKARVTALEA